jgi:hypothetical protein
MCIIYKTEQRSEDGALLLQGPKERIVYVHCHKMDAHIQKSEMQKQT